MESSTPESIRLGRLNIRLPEVLLTLLIPAIFYALVFTFEYAYFQYFFLPTEFIQLTWNSALNTLTALAGSIVSSFFAWFGLFVTFSFLNYLSDEEFYKVRLILYFLLLLDIGAIPHTSFNAYSLINGLIIVGMMLFVFLRWRRRKVEHKIDKLDALASVPDYLVIMLGRRYYIGAFLLISAVFLVYDAGWQNAANKTVFFTRVSPVREVVLANTGDTFILAPYRSASRTTCDGDYPCSSYLPEFTVLRLPDHGSLKLYRKVLGKLIAGEQPKGNANQFWSWFRGFMSKKRN